MASTDNPGALKSAAAEGKLDQIKELIEKQNVDVNQPDEFGDTALHAASQNAREGTSIHNANYACYYIPYYIS